MAIDAAHRSSIYQSLGPILGEEDANVLMSEFPATEADELVTKGFLRAELAGLRTEIAELRTELHTEIGKVNTKIAEQGAGFEAALARQTRWVLGAVVAGLAASTAIGAGFG